MRNNDGAKPKAPAGREGLDLEKMLRHAQKMETLSLLAGGIAHDLNNALGIILANVELLISETSADHPAAINLELVHRAANRSRDLARQILTFTRKSREGFIHLNLEPLLREAGKMLRASLPAAIEIRQNYRAETLNIYADPVQIFQVIVNLAARISRAMGQGKGVLEIQLSQVVLEEALPTSDPPIGSGEFLKLRIQGTGKGLEEQISDFSYADESRSRDTEPGLVVIRGILSDLRGGMRVSSRPETGTLFFDLFLPVVEKESYTSTKKITGLPTGSEQVLLVDDDMDMIHSVSLILKRLGYEVTALTDSGEALAALTRAPDKFQILITDQTMPGLSGLELINRVRAVKPGLPIILCTGYSEAIDDTTKVSQGIRVVMMKPISLKQWAQTIRQVLDESD